MVREFYSIFQKTASPAPVCRGFALNNIGCPSLSPYGGLKKISLKSESKKYAQVLFGTGASSRVVPGGRVAQAATGPQKEGGREAPAPITPPEGRCQSRQARRGPSKWTMLALASTLRWSPDETSPVGLRTYPRGVCRAPMEGFLRILYESPRESWKPFRLWSR